MRTEVAGDTTVDDAHEEDAEEKEVEEGTKEEEERLPRLVSVREQDGAEMMEGSMSSTRDRTCRFRWVRSMSTRCERDDGVGGSK